MVQGIISAAKVLLAAGASEFFSNQFEIPPFIRPSGLTYEKVLVSREFNDYVQLVRATGVRAGRSAIFSAHQMGSCRMSSSPKQGAVSESGKVYGADRLFVADASVFPTASGVNPMVTTYSMAYSIAQGIKKELGTGAKL
jgi:choline dehydrogenase-like flavoprotein